MANQNNQPVATFDLKTATSLIQNYDGAADGLHIYIDQSRYSFE